MLLEARKEGATDDDIRQYWNLHELERRMVDFVVNENNTAMVLMLIKEGHTPEEATVEVRKRVPIYGRPKDVPKLVGDDKPLPIELKDRINIYNH